MFHGCYNQGNFILMNFVVKIENIINMNTLFKVGSIILVMVILFSGCAQKENIDACISDETYGFLGGIWHGIIAPFGLVGMLFKENISVFATNNNGFWYSFGFLIGSGGWGLLAGKSKK